MAKHKRDKALFELLAQERDRQKAKPDARAPEPREHREPREAGAEASPARPPGRPQPRPTRADQPRRAAPTFVTRKAVIAIGGLRLSAYHLAIVGIVVACLCYLFYLLGAEYGQPGDGLPDVPSHPTMEQIQNQRPDGGLIQPGPKQPTLGHQVEPEPKPEPQPQPEPQPEPTGPQYRVRIARLEVSRPDAIDALRAYLARSGIETDLVTRGGYHVLYSRPRFTDKTEADKLANQVNKSLAAFETETGRPTSKDAYTVQLKRE